MHGIKEMLRVQASQTPVFSAKLESTVSSVTDEAREYHVTVGQSIPGPILHVPRSAVPVHEPVTFD